MAEPVVCEENGAKPHSSQALLHLKWDVPKGPKLGLPPTLSWTNSCISTLLINWSHLAACLDELAWTWRTQAYYLYGALSDLLQI